MDARLLFPSIYMAGVDLKGKDVTLTIRRVVVEDVESPSGQSKKLGVIYFEETLAKAKENGDENKEKRMVMSAKIKHMRAIAAHHGYEMDNWVGKKITLYPNEEEHFGEIHVCVRVRPPGAA